VAHTQHLHRCGIGASLLAHPVRKSHASHLSAGFADVIRHDIAVRIIEHIPHACGPDFVGDAKIQSSESPTGVVCFHRAMAASTSSAIVMTSAEAASTVCFRTTRSIRGSS